MSVSKKSPKTILIVSYRILDWLYFLMIPELKKRYKTSFIIIGSENSKNNYSKLLDQKDQFILVNDEFEKLISKGFGLIDIEEERKAREVEKTYSINYMCDILQQDRALSSSFLQHSPNFIWSKNEVKKSEEIIRNVNGYVRFAEKLLKDNNIQTAFVWPVDLLSAALSNVLENKGVFITYPYNSKFKSYGFWADNAFQDSKQLEKSFTKTKFKNLINLSKIQPPETGWPDTRVMDKTYSIVSLLKNLFKIILFRVEFLVLDLIKLDFKKKKRVSFFSSLMFQLNKWSIYRFISKNSERNIKKFQKPFLFYAIPLEPEFSVQARCKEFNDQKAIIKLVALNMPAGYEVVIKEHSDVGRRSKNFYLELLKFPNIRMAHPSIRGIDLVKHARAVASMAGTVSLEASIMGKRVVEFSLHSSFSFLNNVYTIKDISNTKSIIGKAMQNLDTKTKMRIRKDGSKLIQAIKNISFEARATPLFYSDKATISKKSLNCAIELFINNYHDYLKK